MATVIVLAAEVALFVAWKTVYYGAAGIYQLTRRLVKGPGRPEADAVAELKLRVLRLEEERNEAVADSGRR